jgi:hypothetical protein
MRIDPDTCRDPDLLASEVRRLQGVIAAGESARLSQNCDCPAQDNAAKQDKLTDEERQAIAWCVGMAETEYSDIDRKENGCHADDDMAAVALARGLLKRTK